ncbi:MAG: FG-GAP repeat protein [Bacteroidia bacterium]
MPLVEESINEIKFNLMKQFTPSFMRALLLLTLTALLCRHSAQAQNWSEIIKVTASDRESEDRFGYSVAISGDYAIVGAYEEDEDASGGNTLDVAGSAYIFLNQAGTWTQVQKIVASDREAGDRFGYSVAISGDYAVVGAYNEDEDALGGNSQTNAGSAYIFHNQAGYLDPDAKDCRPRPKGF